MYFDNTCRKTQWLGKGKQPISAAKPDIHRKEGETGSVFWSAETWPNGFSRSQQIGRIDKVVRRQGLGTSTVKFLHDNASSHVANTTQQKIEE